MAYDPLGAPIPVSAIATTVSFSVFAQSEAISQYTSAESVGTSKLPHLPHKKKSQTQGCGRVMAQRLAVASPGELASNAAGQPSLDEHDFKTSTAIHSAASHGLRVNAEGFRGGVSTYVGLRGSNPRKGDQGPTMRMALLPKSKQLQITAF